MIIGFVTIGTFLIIVSIFCTSLPTQAIGAEWKLFFENQWYGKIYIDTKSIVRLPEKKIRAWEKTEGGIESGSLILIEIDCRERKYTCRAMEPIDKNDILSRKFLDKNIRYWTEPYQKWAYLSTSDYDEAIFETWCSFDNTP